MGPFRAGRFQQFTISCQRTRQHLETDEADDYTPTSGSFGYDKTSQATFDWDGLDDRDDDYLDKARGW